MNDPTPPKVWLASADEENWSSASEHPTRDAAILEGPEEQDLKTGARFWVGVRRPCLPFLDKEELIERLDESVGEEMSPVVDFDGLELSSSEAQDLWLQVNGLLATFFATHGRRYFTVEEVTEHEAP